MLDVTNIGKKTFYSIKLDKLRILKKYLHNYIAATVIENSVIPAKKEVNNIEVSKKEKMNIDIVKKDESKSKLYLKKHNYQFPTKKNTDVM